MRKCGKKFVLGPVSPFCCLLCVLQSSGGFALLTDVLDHHKIVAWLAGLVSQKTGSAPGPDHPVVFAQVTLFHAGSRCATYERPGYLSRLLDFGRGCDFSLTPADQFCLPILQDPVPTR